MSLNTRRNKQLASVFIGIIFILLTIFCIAIYILFHPNPFRTADEKKTKSLYLFSTENVKQQIDLMYVSAEDNSIEYTIIFRKFDNPNILSEDEVATSYEIVKRALSYLNSSENTLKKYTSVRYEFRVGHGRSGPSALSCFLTSSGNTYEFTRIDSNNCSLLSSLYVMKEVQYINYQYNGDFHEKLDLLRNLTAIKEINIESTFVDGYKEITDDLEKLLPGCKITWNE